jgi:hypothetical protein
MGRAGAFAQLGAASRPSVIIIIIDRLEPAKMLVETQISFYPSRALAKKFLIGY